MVLANCIKLLKVVSLKKCIYRKNIAVKFFITIEDIVWNFAVSQIAFYLQSSILNLDLRLSYFLWVANSVDSPWAAWAPQHQCVNDAKENIDAWLFDPYLIYGRVEVWRDENLWRNVAWSHTLIKPWKKRAVRGRR